MWDQDWLFLSCTVPCKNKKHMVGSTQDNFLNLPTNPSMPSKPSGETSSELPPALLGLAGTPLHTAKSLAQSNVIAAVELMAPSDGMLQGSWVLTSTILEMSPLTKL